MAKTASRSYVGITAQKFFKWRLLCAGFTCMLGFLSAWAGAAEPALQGRIDVWGMPLAVNDDLSVSVEVHDTHTGTTRESEVVDANLHLGAGVRALTWLAGQRAWVTGLDVGYIEAKDANYELQVQPVSVFVGLQDPRAYSRRPRPYLLAGLTMFSAWGHATVGTLSSSFRKTDWWIDGTDDLTSYLAAGFTWPIAPQWSLLIDARRQRFKFDDVQTNSMILPTHNVITDISIDFSGVSIGITWSPGALP